MKLPNFTQCSFISISPSLPDLESKNVLTDSGIKMLDIGLNFAPKQNKQLEKKIFHDQ